MTKKDLESFYVSDGTWDFLSIEDNQVRIWGFHILPKVINIDERIQKLISKLQIPQNEVLEIVEDDVLQLFESVTGNGKNHPSI